MKKKETKLLVLVSILLVCVIAFKLVGYFTDKAEEKEGIDIFNIKQEDIVKIDWTKNGNNYSFFIHLEKILSYKNLFFLFVKFSFNC